MSVLTRPQVNVKLRFTDIVYIGVSEWGVQCIHCTRLAAILTNYILFQH